MELKEYNKKRNFTKTKEPIGKKEKGRKKLKFCVQHHIARKDHFDFRLEYDGVLLSWAIPKGPSYNPNDKRLAIHVENHPLSYRTFEGTIPKGNYGAGTVLLFDIGYFKMQEDFHKTYKKGYLKFTLFGKRLKGNWTLIKLSDKNWILIKENDGIKLFDNINEFKTSIKSGKTLSELNNDSITITHPDKKVYKNPSITKKDIINYYKKVYERMYPFLENRLISTVRSPDGNSTFFKKHFEENKYLTKKKVNNEYYYYIENINALLYEVQLNSIEFHIWTSITNDMNHPDMLVFDLDPDVSLSIKKVRLGVKRLKEILDELNLKSYLKTSGGKGYHIVVPLKAKYSWQKTKKIAEDITNILVNKYPDCYTNNMRFKNRKGKIFIDYFRNNKGSTFVAPYSLRLRKKASVSMPIKWSELDKIKPNEITINDALKRLKRIDPWEDFFN